MVQTILSPTDGSENSYRAMEKALELIRPQDATVHVLSVVEPIPERDRIRYDPKEEANEALARAEELVAQAGCEFVGDTRTGSPSKRICEYADEHDIDMIVMGTHGRTGLSKVLLGSVAQRTVQHSSVPVLTVPSVDES
jgi:nucleotide-binding universal stress UspA family protein